MRAHSKGLETGEEKKRKGHIRATCKWYLLYTGLKTPDDNTTCRLCVPTRTYGHPCYKALPSPVRAGGLKPDPESGLKLDS